MQGAHGGGGNFTGPVLESQGAEIDPGAVQGPQRFQRDGVESAAADAGGSGVKNGQRRFQGEAV
jgi:hypothetical protein